MKIYTQQIAADIAEEIDNVLDSYDITVPSPEDDQRDELDGARLYGSVYWDIVSSIEEYLIYTIKDLIQDIVMDLKLKINAEDIKIVTGEYGTRSA